MPYRTWLLVALAVLMIGLAWHQVFLMTGILWWDAPQTVVRQPAPPPLQLEPLDTSWVDLSAWQRTHPVWAALQ